MIFSNARINFISIWFLKDKGYPLPLAADYTSSSAITLEPPLSPPADIFPIEDFLSNGSFDFGLSTTNAQPCANCPLFQTCAKDAPQRLICATSSSPPQSPLSPELLQDDDIYTPPPPRSFGAAVSLGSHPDYCLEHYVPSKSSSPSEPLTGPLPVPSPTPASPASGVDYSTPLTPPSPQECFKSSPTIPTMTLQNQLVLQQQARCCASSALATSNLPPLLDDLCNCQVLVQREMAKINASLDTISALMQLQNVAALPTATFKLPDTTFEVRHALILGGKPY